MGISSRSANSGPYSLAYEETLVPSPGFDVTVIREEIIDCAIT
jgi:hypothetical protein